MYTYIIIDDERLIRPELIRKIEEISSEKFECIGEAENGKKGMELLEEITPDIIITDMKMAKMDGVEFLKNLHEIHPDIPVPAYIGQTPVKMCPRRHSEAQNQKSTEISFAARSFP